MKKRIAIVGWWAAGMMVAATLLEREDLDAEIHLFEKNSRLWAKVIISGWGRCNVTTGLYKKQDLLPKYPRGATFLEPALEGFGPRAIRRRFEAHGVPLKQEDDGRIFPVSDEGKDIVGVFERLFARGNVHVHLKTAVEDITKQGSAFCVTTDKDTFLFDHVVITTWGNAYAHTWSTGDGYARARGLGHTITPLGPSLNSFLTADTRLHACSGISFSHATLKKGQITSSWPVLLTHFWISWPATFAFSSHIPYVTITKQTPYTVLLQPDATLDKSHRQEILTSRAVQTPKKELGTLIRQFFTKKFIETVFEQQWYDTHLHIGNLSKEKRTTLATLFGEGIPLTLIQRRPWDEFVTAGGVALDEVDPQSGQSRLVPWLYFAGEVLDVDGYTGGYNLTSSRAMGRLVGKSVGTLT